MVALSSGIDAVGVPELSLHLFVVFFAVMSTVTPPVALAAFAAASIAESDPTRTAFAAAKIGLAGFLIPFVFIYHPALLYKLQIVFVWLGSEVSGSNAMLDADATSWFALCWIITALAIALWLLSSALAGHDRTALNPGERVIRITAALAMLHPGYAIAIPAAIIGTGLLVLHRVRNASPRAATID